MNTKVQFLHNNKLITIDFSKEKQITPTTTVLQYLRQTNEYKGTKEGCAEGDCGACTVNLVELVNGKLKYRAVNSCLIFLPALHGKQLITVENLGNSKQLHPIQQAMLETDASQCGFCTPGFVMSMLPLYKQKTIPDKEEIEIALAGNLCRCTGYRPIIDAAQQIAGQNENDKFSEYEKETLQKLQEINRNSDLIEINNNSTSYFLPKTIKQALIIQSENKNVLIINGSTDVALRVTKKFEHLKSILDLTLVEELNQTKEANDKIIIGSGVKLEDICEKLNNKLPAFAEMLKVFGSRQIRNIATLGGNIGSASPIGDSLPVLMAYNAKITLKSLKAERQIALREFITGYRTTQMNEDELITSVEIPIPGLNENIKFYKLSKRKDLDISTVSAAFNLKLNKNTIENIEIFYGGMAATTQKAENVCNFLAGKDLIKKNMEKAGDFIKKDFTPISDARAGAEARLIMAQNLILKFYDNLKTNMPG